MSFRRAAFGVFAAALIAPFVVTASMAAEPAKPDASAATAEQAPKPVIKKFGVWATRCDLNPKDAKQKECHAFVDIRVEDGKQRILYLGVGYIPKKTDGSMFIFAVTPLGTILPPGLGISIDNKTKFGGPFLFCLPMGCQAEAPLTAEQLKALKSGKELDVIFKHAGQGDVKVPVKLDGYSKAIADLPKPKA
ncbi:MAG TPA: invasion associated locus B family protein [Parvibaculum sp.]|uniref:invasion associated locus B family protein n=1 Tax=Parvibaculum sp. TaxID=2024848 RepID=UPI002BF3F650|nr:invasion associated locus B family protein [Parvibaculum sp.]HMM14805.1 invasion associated locus B family protein [Parvibaculum sp.]